MADPSSALLTAVLTALDNACSCEVYDAVPQNEVTYPYLALDYERQDNQDFLNKRMDYRVWILSIFDNRGGRKALLDIVGEIQTLNEQPLTLTEGELVSLRVEQYNIGLEPDGRTYVCDVLLRIYTTH